MDIQADKIALKWSITAVEMYSTLNCKIVRQV